MIDVKKLTAGQTLILEDERDNLFSFDIRGEDSAAFTTTFGTLSHLNGKLVRIAGSYNTKVSNEGEIHPDTAVVLLVDGQTVTLPIVRRAAITVPSKYLYEVFDTVSGGDDEASTD